MQVTWRAALIFQANRLFSQSELQQSKNRIVSPSPPACPSSMLQLHSQTRYLAPVGQRKPCTATRAASGQVAGQPERTTRSYQRMACSHQSRYLLLAMEAGLPACNL